MDFKQMILEAGIEMQAKNLTIETWGNISIRDPESGLIYITPSGMPYDKLNEDDIVVLNPDGTIHEGKRTPSVESGLHTLIYQNRTEINAVLHTHPVDSSIFGMLRKPIPMVSDELAQAFGEEIKVADYALPGSKELAENAVKALGTNMACLLANHGALCVGRNMQECFKTASVLESQARIYYKALCIGTPVVLKEDDVAYMRDFALNKYGKTNQ